MEILKFNSSDFAIETPKTKKTYIQRKSKLVINAAKAPKWTAPKIIEIDGERFDLWHTENMPLSGKRYSYSNVTRFKCNYMESVKPITAIFW